ncbi:hypothetical protein [Haloarcula litorea]|uniref:hypothetical protein n=1 Tax=Haloarcula litorea TaxID=3032579 RepID=UPI0023E7F96C|nr:hypothetical protein [Halomicroarcula sp. GDY20]
MTTTTSRPADAADTERPNRHRRKAVLFCPVCGHESGVTGDWRVEYRPRSRLRRCPECDAVVSDQ